MPDPRPHIFDLDLPRLTELMAGWGMPRYRARQVLDWVYQKKVIDPQQMSNLSKPDREAVAANLRMTVGRVLERQVATDGVQKLLMDWSEPEATGLGLPVVGRPEAQTECVMIPYDGRQAGETPFGEETETRARRTACISSQVGCPVGCRFCASGLGGLEGNLTAGQIVEQVWRLGTLLPGVPGAGVERISNVVFMGMGEPLANFEQVTRAIGALMADWGMGISGRRITISTVGLPAQIRRLGELNLPVTLAISLHAPNDELRRQLIPWAEYVTIDQLIEAGRYYFERTGRELTLEYILLRDVNDRVEHAQELSRVARRLRSNINLIRYNEVRGLPYNRPATEDVRRFQNTLRRAGLNVHIRASRGRDIAAACGQLRHEHSA